jgi:TonB family protein
MREGADNANVELGAMLAVVVLLAVIRIVGAFTGHDAESEDLAVNASALEAPAPAGPSAASMLPAPEEALSLGDSLFTAAVDLNQEGAKTPEADVPEAEPAPVVSIRPPPPPSVDLSTLLDSTDEDELIAEATREMTLSSPALRSTVPAMAAPPPTRPPPPIEEPAAAEPEPEIFELVENMPELIGGLAGLQSRIQYPEMARRMDIEGRVFVQFVVDEQGRPSNVRVARGIGGGCDEAAVAAVRQARFTPGRQRGRPVKVRMALPVTFRR